MSKTRTIDKLQQNMDSGLWSETHGVPDTVSARLESALEFRGVSILALHKTLQEMEVPGVASYGTVYRYIKGDSPPTIEFVSSVCEFLRIRKTWAFTGEGEPTEIGEMRRSYQRTRDRKHRVDAAIAQEYPQYDNLRGMGKASSVEAYQELVRFENERRTAAGTAPLDEDEQLEIAGRVGRAMHGVLAELEIPAENLSDRQLNNYAVLLAQAVLATIPRPSAQEG